MVLLVLKTMRIRELLLESPRRNSSPPPLTRFMSKDTPQNAPGVEPLVDPKVMTGLMSCPVAPSIKCNRRELVSVSAVNVHPLRVVHAFQYVVARTVVPAAYAWKSSIPPTLSQLFHPPTFCICVPGAYEPNDSSTPMYADALKIFAIDAKNMDSVKRTTSFFFDVFVPIYLPCYYDV